MLDTINFKKTRAKVEGVDFLKEIPYYLDSGSVALHDYNGLRVVTGKIGNLSVSINPYQLRVKDGSLCKWMLGDNYQTMSRSDVRRAVERLSNTLHLPMERAIITRLDVGLSIPVKEPTANYFNHLGELNYAKRFANDGSLYYYRHSKAERLCFYDKNREQREQREPIPEHYRTTNVLRYEQRYMARLPSLLGVAQVTGAMLYDESFYSSLLSRWGAAYHEIRKVNNITLKCDAMMTIKEFNVLGKLALIEYMGGEVQALAHIKELQNRGKMTAKQAFDLRQAVKRACKAREGLTMPTEAITELDKKIYEAIRFYS